MLNPGIDRFGRRNRVAMTVEAIAIRSVRAARWIDAIAILVMPSSWTKREIKT
jgi:hypothetical protein